MWRTKSFSEIKERLRNIEAFTLPGVAAQHLMAPLGRRQTWPESLNLSRVRRAAVLMLLTDAADRPELILIKRTQYPGVHSGQISLPGGKKEDTDLNYEQTALRETEEEIGVPPHLIKLIGPLSELYIPPSNFLVQPYLGISDRKLNFKPEKIEVQLVIPIDLNKLFHPKSQGEFYVESHGIQIKVPAYKVNEHIIWGATAMMISELKELLK